MTESDMDDYDYNIIEEYDNIIFNIWRVIFYVPIIFVSTILVSITYDYITFKDKKINKKSD